MWNIYDYKGVLKATAHKVEYNGAEGAVSTVSTTITSPTPINWEVSDLIEYRGEMFTLRHIPQTKKQASSYSSGEAYVYNDVTFYSHIDELASCDFLDVVKEDNNIHYSALPIFDFYCETIYDIADRLQANLDRLYTGDKKWTIVVETDPTAKTSITPQSLSFSAEKCSDVLERIVNKLKVNYTHKGRTITLGGKPITIAYNFEYGKGKGLTSIEQSGADGNAIVTRVRAYGSSENIPHRYYNKLWKNTKTGAVAYFKTTPDDYFYDEEQAKLWVKHISETMYVPNLMLPAFRESGKDAYIDNEDAIAKYGLREGTVFFDGNGENEKVCPTIKNMTAERLQNAGINVSLIEGDNGNLDEIYSADAVEDNGMLPDDGSSIPVDKSYFNIYLKDLGFDINDYLVGGQTPVISMQSGTCAGREFEIAECKKQTILGATIYVLNCKRQVDNGIYLAFPNSNYQIKSGDKFSLSSIELPEAYVLAASEKLEELAIEWLEKNSQPNFTFSPEIDALNALRNPEVANALKEGKEMFLYDDDLGINKIMKITNLKIVEGESLAPKYEVTLSDKVQLSLEKRVTQSVVESIPTSGIASSNILSIAQAYGDKYFLNKRKADTASQTIKFQLGLTTGEYIQGNQGAKIDGNGNAEMQSLAIRDKMVTTNFIQGSLAGAGGGFYSLNGLTYAEFDYLTARKGATFAKLIIQEYRSIGGALVVSQANGEIESIEQRYDATDGLDYLDIAIKDWGKNPQFVVGDLVRCQYWDSQQLVYVYYWVEVRKVLTNGISLLLGDFTELPQVDNKLVQMGNTTDEARQGCILITTENSLPRIEILDGINKPKIEDSNRKSICGSLDGFTDPYTGKKLSGYGLWSDKVYLNGEFHLSTYGKSLEDALSNQASGGRNLLVGTNKGTENWYFSSPLTIYNQLAINYNGAKGVQIIKKDPTQKAGWETLNFPLRPQLIKKGKVYHLSFDFMQSLNNTIGVGVRVALCDGSGKNDLANKIDFTNISVDGKWHHYDLTFESIENGAEGGSQKVLFTIYASTYEWADFAIVNLKLEEGLYATEWELAPEDIVTTFAEIKVTEEGIIQRVGNTEGKLTEIEQTAENISLRVKATEDGLADTGIDIENKKIVVTANDFTIKNNKNEVTSSVDANGNWSTNALATKNDDGSLAITINKDNDGMQKFYYPNTNQVQYEQGWNGTSLIRYYDLNGVMLWQLGSQKGFMDADYVEWTAVGLYDTKFTFDVEDVAYQIAKFTNIGDVNLDTYYQHNVITAKMYKTKGTETPINGWFTNEISWIGKESSDDTTLKRGFSHYTNGEKDWSEYIAWDTITNDKWIIRV